MRIVTFLLGTCGVLVRTFLLLDNTSKMRKTVLLGLIDVISKASFAMLSLLI